MEEKKISLQELKNEEAVEVKEEVEGPTPEQIAAAKATLNAQAYKQRKLKEMKEQEEKRRAEEEAQAKKDKEEHMQRVFDGDEPAQDVQEFFDSVMNDVDLTMKRKSQEKEQYLKNVEMVKEEAEEEAEVREMLGEYDPDDDSDYTLPRETPKQQHLEEFDPEDDDDDDDDYEPEPVRTVEKEKVVETVPELVEEDEDLKDIKDVLDDDDSDDYLDSVIDEDDDDDDEDESEGEEQVPYLNYTDEEYRDALGKAAKEKIKIISDDKVIDLSQFKISDKSISVKSAVKVTHKDAAPNQFNWGLFNSNLPITMEEFKSQELATLVELLANSNGNLTMYNRNRRLFQLIYDHDVSEGKPDTMEQWLKDISIRDSDNIYMAVYGASYAGANFIPYNCEECGYVFVSDDIAMNEMVKYETEEDEKAAKKIIEAVNRKPKKLDIRREQISDDYVMDFKDPSLYNIMLECTLLDDNYVDTHQDLITYISYIDAVYYINRQTMTLDKVNLTKYDSNARKEIATKIKRYSKVLKELTQEQLETVQTIINDMVEVQTVKLNYVIPKYVCERCGKTIPEIETTAQNLVFTRQQLARFATMYQK